MWGLQTLGGLLSPNPKRENVKLSLMFLLGAFACESIASDAVCRTERIAADEGRFYPADVEMPVKKDENSGFFSYLIMRTLSLAQSTVTPNEEIAWNDPGYWSSRTAANNCDDTF